MIKEDVFKQFEFHHIGIAVNDIEEAIVNYSELFGPENVSEIYTLESQNIKECFVKNSPNTYIGLVAPLGEDSIISNLIKKKVSYYHLAYKINSFEETIQMLEDLNYKALNNFRSEAFNNSRCIFMYTRDGHLIELIEK